MGALVRRAKHLTAQNGGFWPPCRRLFGTLFTIAKCYESSFYHTKWSPFSGPGRARSTKSAAGIRRPQTPPRPRPAPFARPAQSWAYRHCHPPSPPPPPSPVCFVCRVTACIGDHLERSRYTDPPTQCSDPLWPRPAWFVATSGVQGRVKLTAPPVADMHSCRPPPLPRGRC